MMTFLTGWAATCAGVADGVEVVQAGKNNEAIKATIYRPSTDAASSNKEPIRLQPGPHLFIDDYLIAKSDGFSRRVDCPARDPSIPNPIITAKEDLNYLPYMTVLRDRQTGQFRIWYGVPAWKDGVHVASHVATMESEDGIHWQRPSRVLDDPAPIAYGCSVIDEGSDFADPSARYKFGWWADGGLKIGISPDGLTWKPLAPHVVLRHDHDINHIFRDTLRDCYVATISVYLPPVAQTWKGVRRLTMQSTSRDLVNWEIPWYVLTPDDSSDPPETQFYAMNGYLIRGELLIGLVKILHDNRRASDTPAGAFGMGYTTLAWTRDGENWVRDQTPFFEPDPTPGAWDHAHAWMDYQLPVGDEVFIYYGGYKNGHKMNRMQERQIGLVRMPRDRYVSRDAGPEGGTLSTPALILTGDRMTVNAKIDGELRVRIRDRAGNPVPGFDAADCQPVRGDSLAHPVEWTGSLATLHDKQVSMEFLLEDGRLYGFELVD